MKKITLTVSLAAVVVTGLFAAPFARATEVAEENMNQGLAYAQPQLGGPDTKELKIYALPKIDPKILFLKRAELTSQLFVFTNFHPTFNPNPHPHYPVIWCLVRNTGYAHSGPFKTLLRIHRNYLPTIQGYAVMSLPAGSYQWVGVRVWAPYGLTRVYSEADFTHLVPEYIEANNWDSVP